MSTAASRSILLGTSFLNSDGKMVTVVMNQSGQKQSYLLFAGGFMTEVDMPAHGIQTMVY